MTTAFASLVSVGVVAQTLQRSVPEINRAAHELGIGPAARLNFVTYFDEGIVHELREHFANPAQPDDDVTPLA